MGAKPVTSDLVIEEDLERSHARFRTTQWSLIDALVTDQSPARDEAEQLLFDRYWPAAYAHLRRMRRTRDEAAELVQAFFVDVVVGRRLFERADPERGRLRTLVLTALKRYVCDCDRRAVSRGRRETLALSDLGHEEAFLARQPEMDADGIYEQRWATGVLEEAMARCERHFTELGKQGHWTAFRAFAIRPAIGGCEPPPLTSVATAHGFASATQAASAFKVVRKHLKILLREVAAETAVHPDDQEAEYHRVLEVLGV